MSGPAPPAEPAELLRLLLANPVFAQGAEKDLREVVRTATPLFYPAGSFLFRQGEPAAHLFIIGAGEVTIVSSARAGAELVHNVVGPGQLLGELALLTDGRRTAGARAASPTTAWAIGREEFWGFLEATPAASAALLRAVASLVAARESLVDDLLSLDVKGRLAKALLTLGERHGRPDVRGGTLIGVRLTHRELAGMVGASRENVSRALAGFRARGFIDYDADAIRLLRPDALQRLT
jgi:CRP/FNR family transcriptional regulator, cyclic AMP receptor protein